jgi:hypothetical protein
VPVFLIHHFTVPASTIFALDKACRQIVSITLFKRMIFQQAVSELRRQSRRAPLLYPTKSICVSTGYH